MKLPPKSPRTAPDDEGRRRHQCLGVSNRDAPFLACALAADADFFITGDRDFTEARKLVNTTIISVSLFKKRLVDPFEGTAVNP